MKKIKTLFKREFRNGRLTINEVNEESVWVLNGEGIATRKFDGTCCMIDEGKLFKRYDCKKGKNPPAGFIAAQDPDPVTGHWPGWLLTNDAPEDKFHREAFLKQPSWEDGTYELVGPKINGNKDNFNTHILVAHGSQIIENIPLDFEGLKEWLEQNLIEGIVWHHPDGRMVKLRRKDFGFDW